MTVETPWADLRLGVDDWAEAFDAAEPGTPHNEARDEVWEALLDDPRRPARRRGGAARPAAPGAAAERRARHPFARAWPLLDPADVVADLWSVPAYLRRCAPWLTADEVRLLQRADPRAWTTSDLPLLDAARLRIGDPDASRRRQRAEARAAAELEEKNRVIDHLIAADDSDLRSCRCSAARTSRPRSSTRPRCPPLTRISSPAPSRTSSSTRRRSSPTPSGRCCCPAARRAASPSSATARRRATASPSRGASGSTRIGLDHVDVATLTMNYRTPAEVMAEAEPVIRAALPDANVPTSIRETGIPVHHGAASELPPLLDAWLADHDRGHRLRHRRPATSPTSPTECGPDPGAGQGPRVRPRRAGRPGLVRRGIEGAVDRYVAMTRATQRLVILRQV